MKLQSAIGSEVFISLPLHSNGKARLTFPVSYIWLASILKIPQNNSVALSEFSGKHKKIKNQQKLCYNLHFKKEIRNSYWKTIPHTQHAANYQISMEF